MMPLNYIYEKINIKVLFIFTKFFGAYFIYCGIPGNIQQPCKYSSFNRRIGLRLLPGLNKNILGYFMCAAVLSDYVEDHTINTLEVKIVDSLERCFILFLKLGN